MKLKVMVDLNTEKIVELLDRLPQKEFSRMKRLIDEKARGRFKNAINDARNEFRRLKLTRKDAERALADLRGRHAPVVAAVSQGTALAKRPRRNRFSYDIWESGSTDLCHGRQCRFRWGKVLCFLPQILWVKSCSTSKRLFHLLQKHGRCILNDLE